jgi:lipid II:glycine glycyltransferase (peptidoglycan interpeptide bridge formation enzyme)
MKDKLYKKENNLFQSLNWLAFQEEYGRQVVNLGDCSGIVFDLPFRKKFVWIQKGPALISNFEFRISNLPKGTIFIRLEPSVLTETEIKKARLRLVTKGSLLSGQASPKATRVLDISKTEEEILAQMKPKARYNIRLAEKKGVEVKRLDNEDILYDLLKKTATRDKGYSPHEKSYYTKMVKDLAKNDVAHVFVAEHEGDFLAAILVSFFGEVSTYLHGGFNEQKRNLMAPYLCQWEAIRYAKSKGCKIYDFWGVAETDDPNDSWAGISRFKEGFGGEKVVFSGSYDLVINSFWYNLLSLLAKIRRIARGF